MENKMETIETFCPSCCKPVAAATIERNEDSLVKGEPVTSFARIAVCPLCGEEIGDSRLEEGNVQRAYDAYRSRHNLISPGQIKALRSRLGISQKSLALLLGIGEASIVRYEDGSLPSTSNNRLLLDALTNEGMLRVLRENGRLIPPTQLNRALEALNGTADSGGPSKEYAPPESDGTTGYKVPDIDYIGQCVSLLASLCRLSYITRIGKALFVSDFLAFESRGEAITGLRYARMQHGPVPVDYSVLFQSLERLGYISRTRNEYGECIYPKVENYDAITEEDMRSLKKAAQFVDSFTSVEELSNCTHSLALWACRRNAEIIEFEAGDEVTRLVASQKG
jgi:putative zinc finger/helix-turn-helix YgiT family protein